MTKIKVAFFLGHGVVVVVVAAAAAAAAV